MSRLVTAHNANACAAWPARPARAASAIPAPPTAAAAGSHTGPTESVPSTRASAPRSPNAARLVSVARAHPVADRTYPTAIQPVRFIGPRGSRAGR
jgi:hypothetical protein